MSAVQVVPPEPALTLGEAKLFLRVDGDEEDALIGALVVAAGAHAERVAGQAFGRQEWEIAFDGFPDDGLALPFLPVVSVESVTYRDAGDVVVVADPAGYRASLQYGAGRVLPLAGWPVGTDAVVRVVAGYGWTAEVRQAVRMLVAYWYDQRTAAGARMHDAPLGFHAIIGSLRRMSA